MKTRAEITQAFRAKYEKLRSSFWEIGPLESNRLSRIGDVYVCDLGQNGRAAFVMYENSNVVEVHGGIYEFWKQKGGANGELGLPVSDETDYYGPDARPGDRVSKFENGIAVWRADTWQTELRNKSEANAPFDVIVKFREKYDLLKQAFPEVGEPIEPGIYRTPNGGWQCNYVNCAAITIRPADSEAHEVYGGICTRWYQEGGAFDETCKPGWLGFPVSGVETFHDLGDSNDRIVHFERGDIVWIAHNNETRIINSLISKQEFVDTVQRHRERVGEKVVEIIADHLGIDKAQISRDSTLYGDLHADSFDLVEINIALEEEFGVCFPDNCWQTVGEIEQFLLKHSSPYADKVANGELGRPVSDEADYHGLDARPGDRVSEFENGVIVWRADTGQKEVRTYLWHDEFDGYSIDKSKWSFDIGTGNNGWGNNEKEYYTDRPENVYVQDGVLHIRAVKESYQGSDYTSARMVSKGKFSFTYGTVEARIALPSGKGIWPAFWMLGENIGPVGWPACGEIDIIEAINDENVVYGTNHWSCKGNHAQYGKSTKDFYGTKRDLDITQFHTYKMVWSKDLISMYVDDFKYHEISIKDNAGGTDAFHKPFFLLLNVAVGGNWPGFDIDDSQFPNEMLVDYIRIWE